MPSFRMSGVVHYLPQPFGHLGTGRAAVDDVYEIGARVHQIDVRAVSDGVGAAAQRGRISRRRIGVPDRPLRAKPNKPNIRDRFHNQGVQIEVRLKLQP